MMRENRDKIIVHRGHIQHFLDHIILCPRNNEVHDINETILQQFNPNAEVHMLSVITWQKWLSYYLYFFFFSFLFLLSWTYYIEGSMGKYYVISITSQEVIVSHHMTSHDGSHDRHGKVMHRPCSSFISSIKNLTGTLSSSLCQLLNKEQLA